MSLVDTKANDVSIEDCRWAIADYHAALPRARSMLGKKLDEMHVGAIGTRFLVERELEKRWEGGSDDDCIASLAEYVAWSDVIRDICKALGRSGERCR